MYNMNYRVMKCGKQVYAIGQERSLADAENKKLTCSVCLMSDCQYRQFYKDEYRKLNERFLGL